MHIAHEHVESVRADWDDLRVGVMYWICRLKLEQNPYVGQKLRQTGDLYIVEDSPADFFWGCGPNGDGRNELGRIWMRLRDNLPQD